MKNRGKQAVIQLKDRQTVSEYCFDEKALLSKQKRLEIVMQKASKDPTTIFYNTIKHRGQTYEVGEYIELFDVSLGTPYVGKLVRIVKAADKLQRLPFIQIQWCLRKHSLPKEVLDSIGKHLSTAEVFPSTIRFCLYVESLKGKCKIMPLQEYSSMNSTPENVYFSRAQFKVATSEIIPPPKEWKTDCICEMPTNPDLVYVECGKCQKWFHDECVKIKDYNQTYVCDKCHQESDYTFEE